MVGGERTGVRALIMDKPRHDSKFSSVRRLMIVVGEGLNADGLTGERCDAMRQAGEIPEWKMRIYRLIFHF